MATACVIGEICGFSRALLWHTTRSIPHHCSILCSYSRPQLTLKDTAFNTTAPTGFDSFLGTFSVPHIPRRVAHIVYLFTGLQNIDWYVYWTKCFAFTNVLA